MIDRGELFVTTKLWFSDYGYDQAFDGFEGRLRRLGLDYVDLFLLHQPRPDRFRRDRRGLPGDSRRLLAEGRVRAIGVSNFSVPHLESVAAADRGRACGEPGRGPSVLHAAAGCAPTTRSSASRPRRGRRSAASTSTGPADPDAVLNALDDPSITWIADKAWQDTSADPAALAHRPRTVSAIPEVGKPHRGSPRTSTCSTSS